MCVCAQFTMSPCSLLARVPSEREGEKERGIERARLEIVSVYVRMHAGKQGCCAVHRSAWV